MTEEFTAAEKQLASKHLIRVLWTWAVTFEVLALALIWFGFYLGTKVPAWAIVPLAITALVLIIICAGFGIACAACVSDEKERAKKLKP